MKEYLKSMIERVNDNDDLYLNCYSPMNRHLIRNPVLVEMEGQLFIGNKWKQILINVAKFEDIKITRKENYGGNFY